jgi:Flavin-binding monooxygenase-like
MNQFSGSGRRVCIIGAGIAGLVTAKVLRDDGFEVIVFDRSPTIGGVWAPSRTYPGLRANNPRETYAFSDFPYPDTADDFPTAQQVRAYLDAYAEYFGLRPFLRLATEVRTVSRTPELVEGHAAPFEVTLRTLGRADCEERLHCDFVAVCKRARLAEFAGPTTLALETGDCVEADVVIFATGWRQGIDFLSTELRNEVIKGGKFHLYRHILSPHEPRLGFIGYASSIACQLTSEIAAHWLSQCFRGELKLPAAAEMEREISRVHAWAEEVFPARTQGYFVGPFLGHYIDELMRDMGLETRRTHHLLSE